MRIPLAPVFALLAVGPALADGVTTYHNSNTRHGEFVVPGLTQAAAATLTLDPNFAGTVSGNVYAQPLFWKPPHTKSGLVIVATENNVVTALDETSGAAVWQQQLPAAVPRSQLACGNIDPDGVTGTPVIDPKTGLLFLDADVQTANGPRHYIYALNAATGAIQSGWPLDVQAALGAAGISFTTTTQGERSALTVFDAQVYVVYGGRAGDCNPYHGVVVQIAETTPQLNAAWVTRASRGGIWSQGGLASDGSSLFVTTGNTEGAQSWGDGEAIIRLKPGLAHSQNTRDYFAPSNWQELDADDLDLGGTMAIPFRIDEDGRGVARSLALGKDGNAYLVNRKNLGGIGGALAVVKVSQSGIKTAPAVYDAAGATFVAFQNAAGTGSCTGNNLTMLSVTPKQVNTAWCATFSGGGAPIITTSDGTRDATVWVLGAEGDNLLHGFDVATGKTIFGGGGTTLSGLHHFQTLIAADRHLYVGADNRIYAFTF